MKYSTCNMINEVYFLFKPNQFVNEMQYQFTVSTENLRV